MALMARLTWRLQSMSPFGTYVKFCGAGVLRGRGSVRRNASRRCGVPIPGLSIARQHLNSTRMETVSSFSPIDYSLAIKNRGHPPKSWRWEIYAAGKSKPVRQSEFFETMSEATRAGKVALAELRANSAA